MKLFLVHTGYYDNDISNGFYESHTNYFVVGICIYGHVYFVPVKGFSLGPRPRISLLLCFL